MLFLKAANFSHGFTFIFLFDWCFTAHSSIFHLFDGGQHYGWKHRKTMTIRRLLEELPKYVA